MTWGHRVVTAAILVPLIVGGCGCGSGSGSGSGSTDDDRAPLADQLTTSASLDGLELSVDESGCVARMILAAMSDERVAELGLDDEDAALDLDAFSANEGRAAAASVEACVLDLPNRLESALSSSLVDDPAPDLPVADAEATCVADQLVSSVGAARLVELAISSDGVDPFSSGAVDDEDSATVAAAFLDCLDIRSVLRDQFTAGGVPAETADCLAAAIPEPTLRDLFTAQYAGDPVDPDELLDSSLAACGLG